MESARSTAPKLTGTVKWYNQVDGFGFITRDDDHTDCFVQRSSVSAANFGNLAEGDRVEFDVVESSRGPSAERVAKLVDYRQ